MSQVDTNGDSRQTGSVGSPSTTRQFIIDVWKLGWLYHVSYCFDGSNS